MLQITFFGSLERRVGDRKKEMRALLSDAGRLRPMRAIRNPCIERKAYPNAVNEEPCSYARCANILRDLKGLVAVVARKQVLYRLYIRCCIHAHRATVVILSVVRDIGAAE